MNKTTVRKMYRKGASVAEIQKQENLSYSFVWNCVKDITRPMGISIERYRRNLEKFESIAGIYYIKHTKTGRFYIGSSINVGRRLRQHLTKLDHNKHKNKTLQQDFNNDDKLLFGMLTTGLLEDMDKIESVEYNLIRLHLLSNKCYNKCLNADKYKILKQRDLTKILSKVVKQSDGCWTINSDYEYPRYCWYNKAKKQTESTSASRVVYYLTHKELPPNLNVCHSCDNTKCVNPDHLFLGSNYSNVKDRTKKNRGPKKRIDRTEVKKLLQRSLSVSKIAKKMDCSTGAIYLIKKELGF